MAPRLEREDEYVDPENIKDSHKDDVHWHCMSNEEAETFIKSNLKNGISTSEAADRLEKHGPNQLTEKKKKTMLQRIWEQVNNILVFILVVVAVVSGVKAATTKDSQDMITSWIEVGLIIGVIVLNTWIGIQQEAGAEQAAEALKNMLSSDATVIRDGKKVQIDAREIVPGDIVVVSLGDRIPADLRMVEVNNLACQEAALTGESLPIEKMTKAIDAKGNPRQVPLGDRKNMCFSATLVSQGDGVGIAVNTGDRTEIGIINGLVNDVEAKKADVLEQIDRVSKWIAVFVLVVGIVTFVVSYKYTKMDPLKAVSIALVCAVAMIPEGLAAIVTLTYSWAVSNMAKQNAIVRVLPAVETLGSVTVICSDKTGTLTKNEMSLVAFVTSNTRYRFNTDYTEATHTNFVRDDDFMAANANDVKRHQGGSATLSFRSTEKANDSFRAYVEDRKGMKQSKSQLEIVKMAGAREHGTLVGSILENASHRPPSAKSGTKINSDAVQKNSHQYSIPTGPEDSGPFRNGTSPTFKFLHDALAGGVLCSKSELGKDGGRDGEIGNPTEIAILRAAYFSGINIDEMRKNQPEVTMIPFSSEYKYMATVHEPLKEVDGYTITENNEAVIHVKGAPDRMIPLCSHQAENGIITDDEVIDAEYWSKQAANLSSHGLRVIALCRGTVPMDQVSEGKKLKPEFVREQGPWMTMIGLFAIMDPPRPECIGAITEARGAGVRVAMITGDHKDTALAIGDMLGLVDEKYSEGVTGPELDTMTDDEIREAVMKYNVFARASPENKIQIVKALQAENQVVSMTGDGVNDAPALKAADMGVAMGKEGTDVAREAAEMILADDNFATIVVAVREGRVVWDNLRKVLLVNTPINNAQGLSVLFALVCGLQNSPLTAIQILYCNLICAVTLGFVLAIEPAEEGIMNNPPRRVGKRIIGRFKLLRLTIATVALTAVTVGSIFLALYYGYDVPAQRSQAFNTLTFGAVSVCLSARFSYLSSLHPRVFQGNVYVLYAIALVTALQCMLTYVPGLNSVVFSMGPMDWKQWVIVVVFMIVVLVVMEIEKAIRRTLRSRGYDTDDTVTINEAINFHDTKAPFLPKGASELHLIQPLCHRSE